MKKLIINTACTLAAVSILSACSSTSSENTAQDEVNNAVALTSVNLDMMTNCALPDSAELGPLSKDIFVVGSFPNVDWKHVVQRKLTYKGNTFIKWLPMKSLANIKCSTPLSNGSHNLQLRAKS